MNLLLRMKTTLSGTTPMGVRRTRRSSRGLELLKREVRGS
jgi:hypothetical protein